jgi:hypothetical protein
MKTLELKTLEVDGEKRVAAFVNGVFKEEVDCHSQYSVAQAKRDLREQYK